MTLHAQGIRHDVWRDWIGHFLIVPSGGGIDAPQSIYLQGDDARQFETELDGWLLVTSIAGRALPEDARVDEAVDPYLPDPPRSAIPIAIHLY